jgi:antitoxin (DNA-binding transcriptional repressor) of toxin-antitoxin stability system
METVRADELPQRYPELIERAAHDERIILTNGDRQVALVSLDDLTILEDLDREQDRQDVEEYRRLKADPMQIPHPFIAGTTHEVLP